MVDDEELLDSQTESSEEPEIPPYTNAMINIANAVRFKTGRSELLTISNIISDVENLRPINAATEVRFITRSIDRVTVPPALRSIGDYAFANCIDLSEFNTPKNISYGVNAFGTYPSPEYPASDFSCIDYLDNVSSNYNSNGGIINANMAPTEIELQTTFVGKYYELADVIREKLHENSRYHIHDFPAKISSIDLGNALTFCKLVDRSIESYSIPESGVEIDGDESTTYICDRIGDFAFCGCSNLTTLNIPSTCHTVYSMAFTSCNSNLTIHCYNDCGFFGYTMGYWSNNNGSYAYCSVCANVVMSGLPLNDVSRTNDEYCMVGYNSNGSGISGQKIVTFSADENNVTTVTHEVKIEDWDSIVSFAPIYSTDPWYSRAYSALSNGETGAILMSTTTISDLKAIHRGYAGGGNASFGTTWYGGRGCKTLSVVDTTHILTSAFHSNLDCSLIDLHGVEYIGEWAFRENINLQSIIFDPNLDVKIGASAFIHCYWQDISNGQFYGLESVNIPANVSLADGVFADNYALKSATLSCSMLPKETFDGCTSLNKVTFAGSIKTIGADCFCNCTKLVSVSIPASVEIIEECAFQNCTSLSIVSLPNSLKYIGAYAFAWCDISSINIPNSVTFIGASAFAHCNLSNVILPASIQSICYSAFESNQLEVDDYINDNYVPRVTVSCRFNPSVLFYVIDQADYDNYSNYRIYVKDNNGQMYSAYYSQGDGFYMSTYDNIGSALVGATKKLYAEKEYNTICEPTHIKFI